jgi:glucokinase
VVTALALGVDLGGTHVRAAVIDRQSGKLLASVKEIHTDKSPAGVVGGIAAAISAAAKLAGVPEALPCGVGVAAQLRGEVVTVAPNLGWREVPFGALLSAKLGRRVRLVNDLKAAAWGELKAGIARGAQDTYTVFVGSGVGSAVISDNRLVMGAGGVAGEVGHVKVVFDDGRLCGCGERGCLEAYAGGVNLEKWMHEVGLSGGAPELERMAFEGNVEARRLWDFATSSLGLVLANQVTVLNPGTLVLGGGVLVRCPKMLARVTEIIGQRALAASRQGLKIGMAELGDDSGVVGAALLAAETL